MSKPNFDGLKDFIEGELKKFHVPGAGVAVVKDGEVILAEGYGLRDVEKKLPVTADTFFAIGSSTKAFAAMSVALMVDDGKLEWDKPVNNYLPEFKLWDKFASERMTPRDLLCHRSGLPRHDLMWYNSPFTREDIINRLIHLEPSKDFRTNWQYQNLMYMTAGYLAGKVSGLGWERLVSERIFEPLSMKKSNFSVDETQKLDDYALPYREKDEQVERIPFRNIDTIGPAGSINSSVREMTNWLLLQLNKGKVGEKQVISEPNLRQMHAPQMVIDDPMWSELESADYVLYGLGWFIHPYGEHTLIHHGGNIDGFSALVSFMPAINAGVVVLTNLNGNFVTSVITNHIYDLLMDRTPQDWSGKYKGFVDKMKAQMEKAKQEGAADRKEGTQPTHPLEDYTGKFEHPAYGVASITKEGDQLTLRYNNLDFALTHFHYDIFDARLEAFESTMKVTYGMDLKGNIDHFTIPLDASVTPIRFNRMPDESMKDKEFLEQFTGEYELMGMTLTVSLRGEDTLIASVPGQGDQELVPYMGTTFNLKGLTGFSIEFRKNGGGKVTEALITQPGGAFTATRK